MEPLTPDDFAYALENTRVVRPPEKRLSTFGTSLLHYHLVTEDMDVANLSRVREGSILAEKPQIISPDQMAKLALEGFGEHGQQYADLINQNAHKFAILKYGFRIRKSDIRCYDVHEAIEQVVGRVCEDVRAKNDPLTAVLTGIDDGWEVCLLKFMFDMVTSSVEGNLGDFRDKGFL
ncbi:MAG: hypothetical protein OHK005_01700 [Candidatus Methylacidiphilales bacterium]